MKTDINLIPPIPLNRRHSILIITLVLVLIIAIAIAIPIHQGNRLKKEYENISRKLMDTEILRREYLSLENQSISLSKKLEIFKKANSVKGDISKILELMNSSISPYIELTEVSISGDTVSIKGTASNDRAIANNMLKLQENEYVLSVRVQEISLDKNTLERIFHIKCKTLLNQLSLDDLFIQEQDFNEGDFGGVGD